MAADSAISVIIAAEFVGKPAFKSAETSTEKLSKSVKTLAKTLGAAFSVQQVLAYGKAAIKAAAEDEKAQKQLALALKNVGLGRDAASSEEFIQGLQKEFGVLDDLLRPAYQNLAIATRDSAEAQKLLQLALDISSATGKDLASTSSALSKAFLGNNAALSKLGVGISKADLKTKSFKEITDELAVTFKGSATQAANTFQGSMDRLTVASNNAKEIIGQGLINALMGLGDDDSISTLATDMEKFATEISKAIQGIGLMIAALKKIPSIPGGFGGAISDLDKLFQFTNIGLAIKLFEAANKGGGDVTAAGLAHLAELEARYAASTLASSKKLTAEELKQLKAKKLKAAIDKANLALGKGSDVFDMEKISLAAAERNQAEQLGKITSQAQLLQITNDLARLQVKQSILALEEAIKTNDVEAITNATAKLNADLLVLGALTGQKVQLTEIKEILTGILPKDLINMANLDAAIAKLIAIGKMVVAPTFVPVITPIITVPGTTPKPLTEGEINDLLKRGLFPPISGGAGGSNGGSGNGGNYASSGFPGSDKGYNGSSGNTNVTVTVVDKTSGLIQVVQDAVIENNRYGNNLNYAGAIA